jgi:hypothetical protein
MHSNEPAGLQVHGRITSILTVMEATTILEEKSISPAAFAHWG